MTKVWVAKRSDELSRSSEMLSALLAATGDDENAARSNRAHD